ncbi:uncharacterized protein A1O5_00835 [Cladophialophora psammophila CBS 110553]|uniref:Uncharacterized protein n=1 Tax=Cladophialophora psammophila CBS 110553 TaxID=1182543 RepID=W9X797_9EURO|nr:uncharacterized protein A1O5_00835 [Cladophialophora psammophila CBS 110553]EXJ76327.1 hypothetical protein A1O5_00835 [Cladophialophora psammophila CBS 110553]
MPRRSKRRKTASDTAVTDETAPSTVNATAPPDQRDNAINSELKMEAESLELGKAAMVEEGAEAQTVIRGSNNNEAHVDTISNASEAPTFDDIDPAEQVDPAIFDEEEVPDYDVDEGVANAKSKGHMNGGRQGGFNALKSFHGQMYTGMAIGGSHKWNYDQGVWKETKMEPDLWKVDFETTKRRARNAPKGSGAPVGTEYHWLIVAHQHVKKIDANTYTTHLVGSKYKLAHKNVNSNSWSVPTVKGQREREIELLEDAKRRVQGLPPVLAGEKVKVEKGAEKGQQKLDSLFSRSGGGGGAEIGAGGKRKRNQET